MAHNVKIGGSNPSPATNEERLVFTVICKLTSHPNERVAHNTNKLLQFFRRSFEILIYGEIAKKRQYYLTTPAVINGELVVFTGNAIVR